MFSDPLKLGRKGNAGISPGLKARFSFKWLYGIFVNPTELAKSSVSIVGIEVSSLRSFGLSWANATTWNV